MVDNSTDEIIYDFTNCGTNPSTPISIILPYANPFTDVSNIEIFANENFKTWQEDIIFFV